MSQLQPMNSNSPDGSTNSSNSFLSSLSNASSKYKMSPFFNECLTFCQPTNDGSKISKSKKIITL